MNLIDVTQQFPTDEQCLQYIEQMRWPDGVVRCPTAALIKISQDHAARAQTRTSARASISA